MDKPDDEFKKHLLALALPIIAASLSTSIANVALPTLSITFNSSFENTRWIVVSYLISLTGASVLTGNIGDLFDRKKILLYSILFFMMASIACALAASITWLIVFRVMQGICAAAMMNTTMAIFSSIKSPKSGLTMGWIGTFSAIGTASGPTLGGILIDLIGWQFIFYINIPLALISLLLIARFVSPQPINNCNKNVDILGMLVLTFSIISYSLGMISLSIYSLIYIGLAIISCFLFVLIEVRVKAPVISVKMLQLPALYIGAILSVLVSTVMMTTLIIGPFYLIHKLSLTPWQVGLTMSFGPIIAACFGVPAGKFVDHFGSNNVVLAALLIMLLGFLLFAFNGNSMTTIHYMIFIAIITTGYASFQTANNTSILFGIDTKQKGILSGILNLSRNIGLITGATLMSSLFSAVTGDTLGSNLNLENIAYGFTIVYFAASFVMFLAFIIAITIKGKMVQS